MNRQLRAAALAVGLGAFGAVGAASASSVVFFDDFDADAIMRGNQPGMELINWRITDGYVDVIGVAGDKTWYDYWPGNGAYVDLDGTGWLAGRIETKDAFSLLLGEVYSLSFDYAKNGANKEVLHFGVGDFSETLILPKGMMGAFVTFTVEFTSTNTLATIFFAAEGKDNKGPVIDNVLLFGPLAPAFAAGPVVATPLPPGLALLATALAGFVFLSRRRR